MYIIEDLVSVKSQDIGKKYQESIKKGLLRYKRRKSRKQSIIVVRKRR